MSGPVAAVVGLAVALVLVAVVEAASRWHERRWQRRIKENCRIIRELQRHEQGQG